MFDSWNDVACHFADWFFLPEQLSGHTCGNYDDEIWKLMRDYAQCPHFGNIRQAVILMKLADEIGSRWPQLEGILFHQCAGQPSVC